MFKPSLKEFLELSKTANVIPVYKEIGADLDTPVSCFLKLKKDKYAFLLESVEGQETIARYSFLGSGAGFVFQSKGRQVTIRYKDGFLHPGCVSRHRDNSIRFETKTDPVDELKKILGNFKPAVVPGLPRFFGGVVGYVGYDMVRFFERIPDKNPDSLNAPDCVFLLTDTLLAFDHVNHTVKIIVNVILPCGKALSGKKKAAFYADGCARIDAVIGQLRKPVPAAVKEIGPAAKKIKITSNFEKTRFCGIVNKAKAAIRRGDIIQVVLSQRFKTKIAKDPFDIYRNLRSINPSPYMFFLRLNDMDLVGSSPELLVRCEDGLVQTRPIAGTRMRGKDPAEDAKLEKELLADSKERAEHVMLVDLGRNDIGRVAKLGSVAVEDFMHVERYSHVMHIVSDVSGALDKKHDVFDVLRACFPAGTVSGSPKVRAMEIIDELENTKRGPYAGCVGYISFTGTMDTGITIRTIFIKDGYAYVQAGAGIVADSDPEKEYKESQNKARALLEAIGRNN